MLHISVPEFKVFLNYIIANLHLINVRIHLNLFKLLFLVIFFYLSGVLREFLHGGLSRILFILQLFFKISLEVKIHQAILKNKHGAQRMSCFEGFKHSSSCIPKCNTSYLSFEVVLCHFGQFLCVSWFTSCLEWHILNPFNSFMRSFATHQSLHWNYHGLYFT